MNMNMKMKGRLLGLVVAGSLVVGTAGVLSVDALSRSTVGRTPHYSAKTEVSVKTDITLEKAKQIALKDAKSGNITRAHLDKENGVWVFEVEIVDGNIERDYTIDANTGKILEVEVEIDRNLYVANRNKKSDQKQNSVVKNTVSSLDAKITMDKAKEIALKAAKSGTITKVELDRDYGILVYEVEVLDKNTEYEYKIDANTGKIIKTDIETKRIQNSQTQSNQLNKNTAIKTKISLEKAKQIALSEAKSGKITRAELDRENGAWVYEIEVIDGNIEKDYKIHADSGKILDIEVEIDRNLFLPKKDLPKAFPNSEAKISFEKAKEIALKAAKSGQITKLELDRDYGILVYEIEVFDGATEYEYKIDAMTGAIVKTDIETKFIRTVPQQKQPQTNTNTLTSAKIDINKAKQIAMNQAKSGTITKVELDRENGILVYEIEIRDGRIEKDYQINALTGEVIKTKVEADDDYYGGYRYDDDDHYDYDDDDDDDDDYDDDDRYDD